MDLPRLQPVLSSVKVTTRSDSPTFAISKISIDIARGESIYHLPGDDLNTRGTWCNYSSRDGVVTYGAKTHNVNSDLGTVDELRATAREALSEIGYSVAGDPRDIFDQQANLSSAEYLIGARLFEIRGNICQSYNPWTLNPMDEYSGEIYLAVEWVIFSTLMQEEAARFTKEGYKFEAEPRRDGVALLVTEAFRDASNRLSADHRMLDLALRETTVEDLNPASSIPVIRLSASLPYERSIEEHTDQVLSAVVTIRTGSGHGSGFVVTKEGHVLTNAHVVGSAERVVVVFSSGIETIGQVLRKSDRRDAALVKVDLRVTSPLPIELRKVEPLETVYAAGSPADESLSATLTRGIVSAIREDAVSALSFIQADAAVSPGSSGGPLLDANGNVIGMSVAKIVAEGVEGINFFVPIDEVFRALSAEIATEEDA